MVEEPLTMKWLAARISFVPTLAWNLLLGRLLRVRNWWDAIDEHVLVGAFPFGVDADRLAEEGVGGVVNTCEEYAGPCDAYQRLGIQQLRIPTIDFQSPDYASVVAAVEFMDTCVAEGKRIYVHCKAGRGRSATVAMCWLMHTYGMTPEEAQQHLLDKRAHVHRRLAERDVVKRYYREQVCDQPKSIA